MPKQDLRGLFVAASSEAIDFLSKLLTYDPRKRLTAKSVRSFSLLTTFYKSHLYHSFLQSLLHPYFHTAPLATHPSRLPKPLGDLVPRPLAPDEGGSKKKRKSEGMLDEKNGEGMRKVARKLDFGAL